ncbi:MAG: LemA family protein [Thermoanaerobaculales bacterium]|nr:LemA family protein [Thermoanaerobaculales bacterium]
MKAAAIGCLVLVLVFAIGIVGYGVSTFNRLVGLDEAVDTAWAQVENVYQRRADLIPNLVATVKGAADFEQETLNQVVEARAKVGQVQLSGPPDAAQLEAFQGAQSGLSSALSRLLVVVEQYPDIKATQNFLDLQAQLEGTENRITVERMRYNDTARGFNTARRRFPTSIIAGWFGFDQPKPYFEADEGADEAPKVEF